MGKQRQTLRNKRKIKIENYENGFIDNKEVTSRVSKTFTREMKFTIFSIFIVTIVMISTAYAIFSSVQKSESYNTLTVGTLKVDFDATETGMGNTINLNGAYPTSDDEGQETDPYTFKVKNSGNIAAYYNIKILDDTEMIESDGCSDNLLDKSYIKVSVNGGEAFILQTKESNSFSINTGYLDPNTSKTFQIRIWIDESAGNESLGKHYHGKIVVESESTAINDNISVAYNYDSSTCVTGEEDSCIETECYKTKTADSCSAGTIIKYKVNDDEEKYFHVLHDDGETMTLQQRENTVYNTAWYADSKLNTSGPTTILPALETATSGWSNVNDQTYTMGTTNFNGTNAYTGCSAPTSGSAVTCTTNTYTLGQRTGKARMITGQETAAMGCTNGTIQSCPNWMNNYLQDSTNYGGTVNDNPNTYNYGYWTMSAISSNSTNAWNVDRGGGVINNNTSSAYYGARAVVVVTK